MTPPDQETADQTDDHEAARMDLEADAWHEGDDGLYVDCPECGSPAYLEDIATNGRCTGYQGESTDEENAEDVGNFCTAKLSFDLTWHDEP
ncbi:hypothetical protein VB773_22495 [Haloarculaceae archaeon H-GB2-1]|nr:hypothetical protein [Haloarculaceae archaeon H-GB1-1]MEA5389477.1 hypothetical protein [Haloarculaceae archaeon H-GB11]MEA5410070.1 hypothetical protein [Haloarculaceae archaeon H-GB2-1]